MNRVLLVLCCLLLASCFSGHRKEEQGRNPASDNYVNKYDGALGDYLAKDPFSRDGYDHNQDGTYTNRKFQKGKTLTPDQEIRELAGREIWFKSAPNDRFHSYYFPQKLGSPIAWYKILRADRHDKRFQSYGLINDPDCCIPGETCKEKGLLYHGKEPTMEQTFGWEYCDGDQALLDSVHEGKAWSDPACKNPIIAAADQLDKRGRENSCELAFGNPTGAVGYRKFPNPRFNKARWDKIGGWEGYEQRMTESEIDGSIEPPFRVGKACASCHAAFDPLNPPADLHNPTWKNIKGETGNQYINVSAILGSGAHQNSIEYQMFVHARAGALDTSAVGHDFVNNPGTINALINLDQRPEFQNEDVSRWDVSDQPCGESDNCQAITYANPGPGKPKQKFWRYTKNKKMPVLHILKGGEDSVGTDLAAQRVYLNIGMCAEQCWVNHLTNLRELDPTQRGYSQTPFDIRQCRRDCGAWRANEDRIGDLKEYLFSRRPTDLKDALPEVKKAPEQIRSVKLAEYLDQRYDGENLVSKGQDIFAKNCASCHSSQNSDKNDLKPTTDNFISTNFFDTTTNEHGEIVRLDWLGNDKSTSAAFVGTYKCRALHSNHMTGNVWEQFGSNTLRKKPATLKNFRTGQDLSGGRGYYRNISLLNAWAHAPFMHNNGIGPEICGSDSNPDFNPWRTTVKDDQKDPSKKMICENPGNKFDPTVEGRLDLFDASMDELLTPVGGTNGRREKVAMTDELIRMPLGLSLNVAKRAEPLFIEFPKGIRVTQIGSFAIKAFTEDLGAAMPLYLEYVKEANSNAPGAADSAMKKYEAHWQARYVGNPSAATELAKTTLETFRAFHQMMTVDIKQKSKKYMDAFAAGQNQRLYTYLKYYSNCDGDMENAGHEFGTNMNPEEKKALKAFLATL